jgi:hypothetical protein
MVDDVDMAKGASIDGQVVGQPPCQAARRRTIVGA